MAPTILMFLTSISLSISISAMEIALGLLLLLLIFWLYRNGVDVTKDCPYFIPFFIYWLATVLSLFAGSDYANISGGFFAIWPLLYLFVGYYAVKSTNIRLIFAGLALGGVALAISAILDVVMLGNYRGDGFLSIYMSTGNVLAMGAIFSLAIVITKYEEGFKRLLYLSATLIMVIGILYTATRGALLAFLAAAVIMCVFRYRLKGVLAAFLLTAIVIIGVYFSNMGYRFLELLQGFGDSDTSQGWRFLLWGAAWEIFKEYPIAGIGYKAFGQHAAQILPTSDLPMGHPHNAYINQLVAYGVIGFIAFFWLYGKIFISFISNMAKNNYAFMGAFLLLVFFLEGITENNFTDGEVKMFQMFLTGTLLGAIRAGLKDKGVENKINLLS